MDWDLLIVILRVVDYLITIIEKVWRNKKKKPVPNKKKRAKRKLN